MSRAVKNRVNVQRLAVDRKENPIGKTICEYPANLPSVMNDTE